MVMNLAVMCAPAIHFATTIAAAVMIASAIQLVLEELGFVPQTGYTEEILAISAAVFTVGLSLSMFIESLRGIVSPVRGSSRGQIISGNTANQRSPVTNPPYKPNSLAAEGKIAPNTNLVRAYRPGTSAPEGRWTMPRSEIRGLSPGQIQNKFAIPGASPTHIVDVQATGANARVGIANSLGFDGGGIQVELLDTSEATFVNSQPIPPGGIN